LKSFYVTTPIYYVNAKPHLGHAYTTIVADTANRFHRLMGDQTYFLTGTDEHGDKIVQAAEKENSSPAEYADRISALFRDLWPELGIENDYFVRTTDPSHKKCVQEFLQRVYDNGDIYFGEYGGHYCYGCERFYTEKELVDGLCPDHKVKPQYIMEKNYFFRMTKYLEPLRKHIEQNPDFIRPERYRNEVMGLLKEGLDDLCISRPKSRLTWGVELPFDKDYVCYVWFDALLNYVSALGWPDGEKFARYWPAANHIVAKDILKPHAIFWPTMLMSAGVPLYRHLNVHGYWLVSESKMSKSLGNVVEPLDMVGKYGLSAFKYFLLREMSFGGDASFSEQALVNRLNADLANDLGNLFNRALSMNRKYFKGVVPQPGQTDDDDEDLIYLAGRVVQDYRAWFEQFQFSKGLEGLWDLVRALNKYIDSSAPWALAKAGETERLATVMYTVLEGMRKTAVHLLPVMPETAPEMLRQLGVDPGRADLSAEDEWGLLPPGNNTAKSSNLFPRVDIEKQEQEPGPGSAKKNKQAPAVEFGDFQKLDLRAGTVVEASKVKKADKLLHLKVDLGEGEPRSIVAGLAEHMDPGEMVGKQVVVVANLKPRKLMGVLSQGMVLAAHGKTGLKLVSPAEPVEPGVKIS